MIPFCEFQATLCVFQAARCFFQAARMFFSGQPGCIFQAPHVFFGPPGCVFQADAAASPGASACHGPKNTSFQAPGLACGISAGERAPAKQLL